ncbi:MAG TPA: hypothetical protein VFU73_02240 [Actinocrinis sp.]|nr:hypothetical protein [Actinocrinis sp.]
MTRVDAEHFVREMVAGTMAAGTGAVFALRHTPTGELLGMTGLHGIAARSDRRTPHVERSAATVRAKEGRAGDHDRPRTPPRTLHRLLGAAAASRKPLEGSARFSAGA